MSDVTKYRSVLGLFVLCLVVSGFTAFPLASEMRLLSTWLRIDPLLPLEHYTGAVFWVATVNQGLHESYASYPWLAYGTDWLAFAHLAIAVYFIGPLVNPLKNEWVIYAGLVGCVLVLPLALVCGPLRGIPFYWRLIDCSFGVLGAVPLLYCLRLTRLMKASSLSSGRQLAGLGTSAISRCWPEQRKPLAEAKRPARPPTFPK